MLLLSNTSQPLNILLSDNFVTIILDMYRR